MSRIDFDAVEALTFDCYGTLIDWESGILHALEALLDRAPDKLERERLLEQYGLFESAAEEGRFRSYREVLRDVARMFGEAYSIEIDGPEATAFAESVGSWPVFPDSSHALQALATKYRLAIVSNVDDDLFAASAAQLGVTFDVVVTAQQVGSYKPARRHFDEVLERLGLPRTKVLHCAQSLYHDIGPASALGFQCVWVNRRAGKAGAGATPPAEATPDLEVPDLASLASAAGL